MKIYRKRYLPDEELLWLADDKVIFADGEKIITKWTALKPRPDFSHGISCYFLHRNYKISKFFKHDGDLLYYYCDIVRPEAVPEGYVFCDLLVDVLVDADMRAAKILDLDELACAYERRLIDRLDLLCALNTLDGLLRAIYAGKFSEIAAALNEGSGWRE